MNIVAIVDRLCVLCMAWHSDVIYGTRVYVSFGRCTLIDPVILVYSICAAAGDPVRGRGDALDLLLELTRRSAQRPAGSQACRRPLLVATLTPVRHGA